MRTCSWFWKCIPCRRSDLVYCGKFLFFCFYLLWQFFLANISKYCLCSTRLIMSLSIRAIFSSGFCSLTRLLIFLFPFILNMAHLFLLSASCYLTSLNLKKDQPSFYDLLSFVKSLLWWNLPKAFWKSKHTMVTESPLSVCLLTFSKNSRRLVKQELSL